MLATQAALISDVYGSNSEDLGNDSNPSSKKLQLLSIIFFVLDLIDITLDIIFSFQLFLMNYVVYGCLMLFMVLVSIGLWLWSRHLLLKALDETNLRTTRKVICFFEMAFFFIQDATTIFIYCDTQGTFEGDSFATFNLSVTVLGGFIVMSSDFILTVCHPGTCNCDQVQLGVWDKVKTLCGTIFNCIYFTWNLCWFVVLLTFALYVMTSKGEKLDDFGGSFFFLWAFTAGLWLCMVVCNLRIIHRTEEVKEVHLANLGPRLIILTCFPCFKRKDHNSDIPEESFSVSEC